MTAQDADHLRIGTAPSSFRSSAVRKGARPALRRPPCPCRCSGRTLGWRNNAYLFRGADHTVFFGGEIRTDLGPIAIQGDTGISAGQRL